MSVVLIQANRIPDVGPEVRANLRSYAVAFVLFLAVIGQDDMNVIALFVWLLTVDTLALSEVGIVSVHDKCSQTHNHALTELAGFGGKIVQHRPVLGERAVASKRDARI